MRYFWAWFLGFLPFLLVLIIGAVLLFSKWRRKESKPIIIFLPTPHDGFVEEGEDGVPIVHIYSEEDHARALRVICQLTPADWFSNLDKEWEDLDEKERGDWTGLYRLKQSYLTAHNALSGETSGHVSKVGPAEGLPNLPHW